MSTTNDTLSQKLSEIRYLNPKQLEDAQGVSMITTTVDDHNSVTCFHFHLGAQRVTLVFSTDQRMIQGAGRVGGRRVVVQLGRAAEPFAVVGSSWDDCSQSGSEYIEAGDKHYEHNMSYDLWQEIGGSAMYKTLSGCLQILKEKASPVYVAGDLEWYSTFTDYLGQQAAELAEQAEECDDGLPF